MELEYVFKMLLYLFVVVVLIGIIIVFKSKFMNFCLLPPCEKEKECDVSPVKVSGQLTENVIDKYSSLCMDKSKDCKQDVFCYIIALDNSGNPTSLQPSCLSTNKCEIACDKDVNMVYVTYKWMRDKVQIGC
jgi:hypothetical protein